MVCLSIRGTISPTREGKRVLPDICPDTSLIIALDRETDRQMVTLKWRHDGKRVWVSIYLRGPPASLLATPCDTQGKVFGDHYRIYFSRDKDEDRPWAAWKGQVRKSSGTNLPPSAPKSHCPIILVLPQQNFLETWPKKVQVPGGHALRSL